MENKNESAEGPDDECDETVIQPLLPAGIEPSTLTAELVIYNDTTKSFIHCIQLVLFSCVT